MIEQQGYGTSGILLADRELRSEPAHITIVGWLAVVSGAVRIVAPKQAAAKARTIIANPAIPKIGAAIWLAIGALLCFYGYYHR